MDVYYKCQCMKEEAMVWVPDRTETQDVVDWVENVAGISIARDHAKRSPLCMSQVMEYMKIPHDGGDNTPIGARPKPN